MAASAGRQRHEIERNDIKLWNTKRDSVFRLATATNGCATGHHLPFSRLARGFKTDFQVLTDTGGYRQARFTDRLVALDRIAGTTLLVCAAGILAVLIATHSSLLDIPSAMAGSVYRATFGTSKTEFTEAELRLAARPMTANDVRDLQGKLKQLGFDPGTVDGIAGGHTLEALNRYREAKHLNRVSGIDRMAAFDLLD
jgi:hypothetical protein